MMRLTFTKAREMCLKKYVGRVCLLGAALVLALTNVYGADPVTVVVPGTADPWLAGMPNGATASCFLGTACDVAPAQSPVLVPGLILNSALPLVITATGAVSQGPCCSLVGPNGSGSLTNHLPNMPGEGQENGISDIIAPYSALVGVFLDANPPNLSAAPSPATDPSHPALKQVFFVGSSATVTVPSGATRLFLGTMDTNDLEGVAAWSNNLGSFTVQITTSTNTNVDSLVSFTPIRATYRTLSDTTNCPPGFAGKFTFTALLTNKATSPTLSVLAVQVQTLTNGNVLLDPQTDAVLGREGAVMQVRKVGQYADGVLSSGESVNVPFVLCLATREPFQFFVDVLAGFLGADAMLSWNPGWDSFGEPLDYARSFLSFHHSVGTSSMRIVYSLQNAVPNASHTVGAHLFWDDVSQCVPAFGQFTNFNCFLANRQNVTRVIEGFSFGTLTTDQNGNGSLVVEISGIAPDIYEMEFDVSETVCQICARIYQSPGPVFGDTVSIAIP